MSFLPNIMLLIPCQLSTPAIDTGQLLELAFSHSILLCQDNSSYLHQAMRQNWRRIYTPLLPPPQEWDLGRDLRDLSLNSTPTTDLLKEIKCFALHGSQREWHHGLAKVVFSTLQIPSASLQCTRCHPKHVQFGSPSPTSKHILSTHPFQQQVLQTGKSITPTIFPLVQACTHLHGRDK